jgi:hypothetical protein
MDILIPSRFAKPLESTALIRAVLTSILEDDDSYATWSSGSNAYYDRVAKRIEIDNPDLANDIKSIASKIRATYRTHIQHDLNVHEVPINRIIEPSVEEALDDACCLCLQPLKSFRKIVRLRSRDPQYVCGHFLHEECASRLRPGAHSSKISCPICRADLGRAPILTWFDMERAIPRF